MNFLLFALVLSFALFGEARHLKKKNARAAENMDEIKTPNAEREAQYVLDLKPPSWKPWPRAAENMDEIKTPNAEREAQYILNLQRPRPRPRPRAAENIMDEIKTLNEEIKSMQSDVHSIVSGMQTIQGEIRSEQSVVRTDVEQIKSGMTRLVPGANAIQVRLVDVGGNIATKSGRVEVYIGGQWGTVCDDAGDANAAIVFCKMLGFSTGSGKVDASQAGHAGEHAGSLEILMDDIKCSGSENHIGECSYKRHNNCGHHEDFVINCS